MKFTRFLIFFTCLILLSSSVTLSVDAASSNPSAKKVNETAKMLKFMYEEASTLDENGNVIDMDVDMIIEKYGNSPELQALKQQIEADKQTSYVSYSFSGAKFQKCLFGAVADQFGVGVVTAIMEGGFIAYMKRKAYQEAAKLLLKFAVGSNIVGATAFLNLLWS